MFKIEDSGEDRRMVSPGGSDSCLGKADLVVGEPEIEAKDVPYMVTNESYQAAHIRGERIGGLSGHT